MKKRIIFTIFLVMLSCLQINAQVWSCGYSITVTHVKGNIAPVTKTITYGTALTDLTGSNKCWITQNLGSDHQATCPDDDTEASAGWYWQFNQKQGYKYEGVIRTNNTSWSYIDENSNWTTENDPCNLLLGDGWRIPTNRELCNIYLNGNWNNYKDAYASVLKLHTAGNLGLNNGSICLRGKGGYYWSSTQGNNTNGYYLDFLRNISSFRSSDKAYGCSIRCIKD